MQDVPTVLNAGDSRSRDDKDMVRSAATTTRLGELSARHPILRKPQSGCLEGPENGRRAARRPTGKPP